MHEISEGPAINVEPHAPEDRVRLAAATLGRCRAPGDLVDGRDGGGGLVGHGGHGLRAVRCDRS